MIVNRVGDNATIYHDNIYVNMNGMCDNRIKMHTTYRYVKKDDFLQKCLLQIASKGNFDIFAKKSVFSRNDSCIFTVSVEKKNREYTNLNRYIIRDVIYR